MTNTQIKSLPGGIAPPTGLAVAAVGSGGTFAAATYFWKITFVTAFGETSGSNEATVAIVLNGSANLTWTTPPKGVNRIRIYRGTVTNTENVLVGDISAQQTGAGAFQGVTAFTDTFPSVAGSPPAAGAFANVSLDSQSRASLADTQIAAADVRDQVLIAEAVNLWHNTAGIGIGAALAAAELAAVGFAIQDV